MLTDGRIVPIVGRTFPLDEAAQALELMDDRGALGKIVLQVR